MPIRTATVKDASRAEYHLQKGAAALAMGDRREALARYRSALEFDPADFAARMRVAELEAAAGNGRAAAPELARVLQERPAHPEAWNLLGVLLAENGEKPLAARCWRRALSLAPGYASPGRNLRALGAYPQTRGRAPLLPADQCGRLLAKRPARLTACLIVKDEQEMLEACLRSLEGAADEIVVLDTGSTDGTAELARSLGAKTLDHPWKDDFSEARNASLRHASGDWVLVLDADERLERDDIPSLRKLMDSGEADVATVSIASTIGGDTLVHRAVRLVRNYPGLAYTGRIHEQMTPSIRALKETFGLRTTDAPVRLLHLGYEPEVFGRRGKEQRNERLLKAELEENPGNAYALLKQAELLFGQGRFSEAAGPIEEAWGRAHAAWKDGYEAGILEEPATLRAACAVAGGRFQEGLDALGEFHGICPPTANTRYLEGVALWALGRGGAEELLRAAMEAAERPGSFMTLPEISGASPRYILGSLALSAGDGASARRWFEEALERDPSHRESRLGLAEALFREGRAEGAVGALAPLLEARPTDLAAWQAGGVYLVASEGCREAARAWLEGARTVFPADPVLLRLSADLEATAPRAGVR